MGHPWRIRGIEKMLWRNAHEREFTHKSMKIGNMIWCYDDPPPCLGEALRLGIITNPLIDGFYVTERTGSVHVRFKGFL
jgi:hypothetical protein